MNLIKAYIYVDGIEQFIYRKCLRKSVKFMGFLPRISPMCTKSEEPWHCLEEAVQNADENTFFLVNTEWEIPFFESYGIKKERILFFYRMANLCCWRDTFLVLNGKKWLKEHLSRRAWSHASDERKSRYFMKKYIDRDVRLWQKYDCERKERIVFWGVNEWTEHYVKRLGKRAWGVISVDKENFPQSLLPYERQYADLLYEKYEELIFYVANERIARKLDGYLQEIGFESPSLFTYGRWACKALGSIAGGVAVDILDPLAGYTRRYQSLCGFQIFGAPNAPFRIITLGGSTTDPTLENLKSWSEILHDMFKDMGIDAAIYAGGIMGYNSSQECLKLLKDVIPLNPNLVISYSGVNDFFAVKEKHPFVKSYLRETLENGLKYDSRNKILTRNLSVKEVDSGVEDDSDVDQFWLRCEKIMYAICREHGIAFHAFLQANNIGHCYYEAMYGKERIKKGKMLLEKMRKYKKENDICWLHDAVDIFDGESGIFYDNCHAYEKGNRIIARKILPIVLREMEAAL